LSNIRNILRKKVKNKKKIEYHLSSKDFPIEEIKKSELPGQKSLKFTEKDVEKIFDYKKGPYTFVVLSLLYPNLKYDQVKFHQDHLHPDSYFKTPKLKKLGLSDEKIEEWRDMKDKLPNLQLLKGSENQSKLATPLIDWFNKKISDKTIYKRENYFPPKTSLEFNEFEKFYSNRKKKLRKEITNYFLK